MARRSEFAVIQDRLRPLAASHPASLGLRDDAAVLDMAADHSLVISADALVAGVHFLPKDPPDLIARKCLRVNLSDMAAMGAEPMGVLLCSQWDDQWDDDWIDQFCEGLEEDLNFFDLALLGGDTVSMPPKAPGACVVTILGQLPKTTALRRNGAQAGQDLWVSGTLGDAALGLIVARDGILGLGDPFASLLRDRYRLPDPRVSLGMALRQQGLAGGCLDISDGLVADAGHMATASAVRIEIRSADLPLSDAAAELVADDMERFGAVLGGGDDYELLFTADATDAVRGQLADLGRSLSVPLRRIGTIRAVAEGGIPDVLVLDSNDMVMFVGQTGYQHG